MSETFYPFVENGEGDTTPEDGTLAVRYPARIAVFDDAAAAPRVVVVEPSDIRSYLEEITATVTRLAQEQGGRIPFTVIREVVENLIHAYFIEPTISILDGGDTIRFSDQGPGIADKRRALEYGTTSASSEMKRYIRGVGSGLPYAQQWLQDKGGSLTVEDNMNKGTVVTVTLVSSPAEPQGPGVAGIAPNQAASQASYQRQPYQQAAHEPAWQQQTYQQQPYPAAQQGWPQPGAVPPQAAPYPYPYPQGQPYGYPAQPYPQPYPAAQQGWPQQASWAPQPQAAPPVVSERGAAVLEYLRTHESVGPRDLNAWQPLSESTWSRVLSQLEEQGLVSKRGGQKRHLTEAGRRFLGL